MYLIAPEYVVFPFGENISANTINSGLFYIFIGFLFFLIGMVFADKLIRNNVSPFSVTLKDLTPYSRKNLLLLFLLIMGISLFFSIGMGISPYGKMQADSYNTFIQGIKVLMEVDSCFFYVLGALFLKNELLGEKRKKIIIFVVLFYIVLTVINGSRIGFIRVVLCFTVIMTILHGNARINFKKLLNVFILVIVLSAAFYPAAVFSRKLTHIGHASPVGQVIEEMNDILNVKGLISSILNRVGIIDYPILIITQKGDNTAQAKYLDIEYPIKSMINILLPGIPYPESVIMTSRTIDIIYRGSKEMGFLERYNSEFWTLWGISYIYHGWFGGILVMFSIGFICHMLYKIIVMLSSGINQFFLRLWFLLYITNGIIWNMGIDEAFTTIFFGLLQFVFLSFCLYLLKYITHLCHNYAAKHA